MNHILMFRKLDKHNWNVSEIKNSVRIFMVRNCHIKRFSDSMNDYWLHIWGNFWYMSFKMNFFVVRL